ncbi:MAG: prepilin peptidase [Candidatus Dormiibacterota bacterium]
MSLGFVVVVCAAAALAGASFGSFAGVVRSRGWRRALKGRSRCDRCGRELRWYELVPLASYPLQRGRCRSCHAAIGSEALIVEMLGAAAGAAAALIVLAALRL